MARYKYRAKKGPDNVVEDTIEAQNEHEALEKLSEMGYLPLGIEEERPASPSQLNSSISFFKKVSARDVTLFSRQLASLLRSGVPILTAIDIISEQSESLVLKNILSQIHDQIKDGSSFSSSLAQYPGVFSPLFVAMVRTGEDSGALPEVLLKISEHRAKQEEMISKLRMALAYPILMAIVGAGTVVFMLTFVMPRLMKIFMNMGQSLPLPTKILLSASRILRDSWLWIAVGLIFVVVIIKRIVGTKAGRISWSAVKLHIPVFGGFILKAELARFCRTMELLLKNGIPILKAIEIAIPVLENEILKQHLESSYKALEQGGSIGKSLKGFKIFPLFMSNLINVGEESGKLDEAFAEVASSYERDTDDEIRVLASLLEPLIMLGMGLIVGFIVMAMLLPIFEINVMVK